MAIDGLAGVTAMEVSVAAVTVSTAAGEVTPLSDAVMLLMPTPTPVASPVLVIVATEVVAEFQVTLDVTSCVLLSE